MTLKPEFIGLLHYTLGFECPTASVCAHIPSRFAHLIDANDEVKHLTLRDGMSGAGVKVRVVSFCRMMLFCITGFPMRFTECVGRFVGHERFGLIVNCSASFNMPETLSHLKSIWSRTAYRHSWNVINFLRWYFHSLVAYEWDDITIQTRGAIVKVQGHRW